MKLRFDGDADRCVVEGVHGDVLLAALAVHFKHKKIVSTQMFNYGVEQWLSEQGVQVIRTKVGDRFIKEKMKEMNINFGGEECGHIIFPDIWKSGDGLVTSLKVLQMLCESGLDIIQLTKDVTLWPSVLLNIKGKLPACEEFVNGYRILIRQSGTEDLTRILVEGPDLDRCHEIALDAAAGASLDTV